MRYWRPIRVNLKIMLGISSMASLLAMMLMLLQTSRYEASALVEVDAPGATGSSQSHSVLQTARHIILSRSVMDRASESLALHQRPEYQNRPAGEQFRSEMTVETLPQTQLLRIALRSADPAFARDGVVAVTQSYITHNETLQIGMLEDAAELLLRKLDTLFDTAPVWLEEGLDNQEFPQSLVEPQTLLPLNQASQLQTVQHTGRDRIFAQPVIRDTVEEAVVRSAVANYESGLQNITRITVIDPAALPLSPLPKVSVSPVLASFLSSLLICAFAALVWQRRRDTVSLADEASAVFGLPVLASLPLVTTTGGSLNPSEQPVFTEAVRTMRTLLATLRTPLAGVVDEPFVQLTRRGRTILVTSSGQGEGKSEIAVNLALSLGQVEKVLLINSNLRDGSGWRFCDLGPSAPGLSHVVAGAAPLRDCIHTLGPEGIDVMPAGVLPPNPQELLSSKRFRRMLDVLERRYAYVIFDSQSLASSGDSLVLAPQCTDILYAVQADVTRIRAAQAALQLLQKTGGPQPRLVLNGVDFQRARRYGFDRSLQTFEEALAYAYKKPGGSYLAGNQGL